MATRSAPGLEIRLLGELVVVRDGVRVELPPSKKSRALLAYVASNGRPQRRERLCEMFWDMPDDPRGSLRWSLSRLRAAVDDEERPRILADRETVDLAHADCAIDLTRLRSISGDRMKSAATDELAGVAALFRGEFLEGLDLPSHHDYQSWCVAEREEVRRQHVRLLTELAARHVDNPEGALGYVRQLVNSDPFNEEARTEFLRLLHGTNRRQEAESQFAAAERLFRELGDGASERLRRGWRSITRTETQGGHATSASPIQPKAVQVGALPRNTGQMPLIGRAETFASLTGAIEVAARGAACAVVVTGEPGIGKSRLLSEVENFARSHAFTVHVGRCHDARHGAAYAPWVEAIGELPLPDESDGAHLGRQRLFADIGRQLTGSDGAPVLLVIDDIQWMDDASADLLNHVLRTRLDAPLAIVLAARESEIADNPAVEVLLRSLRRDDLVRQISLEPLGRKAIEELLAATCDPADVGRLAELSNGNPLYALELARNADTSAVDMSTTLKDVVRDRLQRLPGDAAELARWASLLRGGIPVGVLEELIEISSEDCVGAIEILLRQDLLTMHPNGGYQFGHDLVRQAVHTSLSEPRRRLMHLKVARLLREARHQRSYTALDVVHHASAGGDVSLAALACVEAGRRALRFFAHAEAFSLARHGQAMADTLSEPDRCQRLVELAEVELLSRPLENAGDLPERLEMLAGVALDHDQPEHAWRCYKMLADIRWSRGNWSGARRDTMHAALLSRTASDAERVSALAEAARCLAMLERDLDIADAFLLEAEGLAARHQGIVVNAIPDAKGLLCAYRGQPDAARDLFREASLLARRDGDRANEFLALSHLAMLEIERDNWRDACEASREAAALAEKIRPGSEQPFARGLTLLCELSSSPATPSSMLDGVMAELRLVDSKHRLSFVALHAARLAQRIGATSNAHALALNAIAASDALGRASGQAEALAILIETTATNAAESWAWRDRLETLLSGNLSCHAADRAEIALAPGMLKEA